MRNKNRIKYPELFQGENKGKHYFEGWYFKHVDQNEFNVFSIIPGINHEDNNKRAFIQVIIGPDFKSYYVDYEYTKFSWTDNPFCIMIADNTFNLEGIKLNINKQGLKLKGELKYTNITGLDSSTTCPNIMGYFAYIKSMQCNHGIMSLNHRINGSIEYNNNAISFNDGKGYIEKDWGTSFPSKYCWLQCNNFEDSSISLSLSIANIPFGITSFSGHICVLKAKNTQYRFATYNMSTITELSHNNDILTIAFKKGKLKLKVIGQIKNSMILKAPRNGIMIDDINETLCGIVNVYLYEGDKCIYSGTGNRAGIEVVNL